MLFHARAMGDANEEWKAILIQGENGSADILGALSNDKTLELQQPITMHLINIVTVRSQRKETPFDADLVYWSDDLMYKAFRPQRGLAIILSDAFKRVLEKFSLPRHSYYPVKLINYENRTDHRDYHLLQFYGSLIDITDFEASEYTYTDRRTRMVVKTQSCGFSNYEDFHAKGSQSFKEGLRLDIKTHAVTAGYDVYWGINNSLLINDAVKNAIDEEKLKGIRITDFTEYQVTCKT